MRLRNGLKLSVWWSQPVEKHVPVVMVQNQIFLWWLEIKLFFVWLQQPQRTSEEIASWDSKSSLCMVASRKPVSRENTRSKQQNTLFYTSLMESSRFPHWGLFWEAGQFLYGTPVWCSEWFSLSTVLPLYSRFLLISSLKSSKINVTSNQDLLIILLSSMFVPTIIPTVSQDTSRHLPVSSNQAG